MCSFQISTDDGPEQRHQGLDEVHSLFVFVIRRPVVEDASVEDANVEDASVKDASVKDAGVLLPVFDPNARCPAV